MDQARTTGPNEGPPPGGRYKVLWLVVGPALIAAGIVAYLFNLADDGTKVLPSAAIGAGMSVLLIVALQVGGRHNRPQPQTMMRAPVRWGLLVLPLVLVVWGGSVLIAMWGFLAGFQALFALVVAVNMFRDRERQPRPS